MSRHTPSVPFKPSIATIHSGMLTGRTRGRIGWFTGRVIMQVEYWMIVAKYRYPHAPKGVYGTKAEQVLTNDDFEAGHWRDARAGR